ncbi:MAG: SGNH/GDSL hydrolase family protein [Elusimicrobiota bacterium]
MKKAALSLSLMIAGALVGLVLAEAMLLAIGSVKTQNYATGWAMDDAEARYVPRPGSYTDIYGSEFVRINARGLRGPDSEQADVLFLGDSCTFGVGVAEAEAFPGLISAKGVTAANAGVPGYNTTAALARLKSKDLLALKPRAVVLYFGWNDHWRAAATERTFTHLRPWAARLRTASVLLRFQESLWRADSFRGRLRLIPQVPIEDFKANLEEMIALSRSAGAAAIIVTAASDPNQIFPSWAYGPDYNRYHQRYLEAARAVAVKTGVVLVDFAALTERLPGEERTRLFQGPVHLSLAGHQRLARELIPALAASGVNFLR